MGLALPSLGPSMAEEEVPLDRLPPSAAQRVPLSKELPVHEPEGRGAHVCSPWQGGQRLPSFIHSLILSTCPLWALAVCPAMGPTFRAITVQFGEGSGVERDGAHGGGHSRLSGRHDIQQSPEEGVNPGFVQSLAELKAESTGRGEGFGATSLWPQLIKTAGGGGWVEGCC